MHPWEKWVPGRLTRAPFVSLTPSLPFCVEIVINRARMRFSGRSWERRKTGAFVCLFWFIWEHKYQIRENGYFPALSHVASFHSLCASVCSAVLGSAAG